MPSSAIAVAVGHDLENLDFPVYMLNRNPHSCQSSIKCLFLQCQRTILALLERNITVGMIVRNSLITAVRPALHFRTHRTAHALIIKREIVNTANGLNNKQNQKRVQVNHDLRLDGMTLLLA